MDNQLNRTEEPSAKIESLMKLILSVRFSDLDRDFEACTELLALSEQENNTYGVAFAYAYLGDCQIGKNDSVGASVNLMRAKELCETHRFLDLLPYVCTWLGLYYEMQNNRQMAMQNYLDALEFAERNQDLMRQSILLNNIASQFQSCGNYEVSKQYYLKAFHRFRELKTFQTSDPHYAQMTANLISACCWLKQIDEAKYYLSLLEESGQLEENQNQLHLSRLLISAAMGDMEATRTSVDSLLLDIKQHPHNLHQLFETFLVVADSLVDLEEADYARKMLVILDGFCKEDEYGHRLKVQYVWMRFYKSFGTQEEKNRGYELFYELRQKSDAILNRNLSDGLLSKIKLRESMKENQAMQKEKEQLEDEVQLDELTKLYNRRSFRILTQQVISDPQVHTLCFIMIDVDYFKQYNDTYGHAKGDDALYAVATSMASAAGDQIYNFRYGGDEFVSMCKNMTANQVEQYIKRFRSLLYHQQIPHSESLCSKHLTLSIGYSLRTRASGARLDPTEMMAEADVALYWSKGQGRNCHSRYTPDMHQK